MMITTTEGERRAHKKGKKMGVRRLNSRPHFLHPLPETLPIFRPSPPVLDLLGTLETILSGLRQRNERSIRRSKGTDFSTRMVMHLGAGRSR